MKLPGDFEDINDYWDYAAYHSYDEAVSDIQGVIQGLQRALITIPEFTNGVRMTMHQIREHADLSNEQIDSLIELVCRSPSSGIVALLDHLKDYRDSGYATFNFVGNKFQPHMQIERRELISSITEKTIERLALIGCNRG